MEMQGSTEKLIAQIDVLREQVRELEKAEAWHKPVEKALQSSKENFRTIFNYSPIGLCTTNVQWDLLDANKAMQDMLGYTLEDLKTTKIFEVCFEPAESQRLLNVLYKESRVRDFETTLRHREGTLWIVRVNVDYIDLNNQRVLLTSIRNITKSKQAEKALRASEEQLRFVKNISPAGYVNTGIYGDLSADKQISMGVQETNQQMATWIDELNERTFNMNQLSEMGEQLQSCQTTKETCDISAQYIQKIFPTSQGALYLVSTLKDYAEAAEMWGDRVSTEKTFLLPNCWAIRRGRPHLVDDAHPGMLCGHITGSKTGQYLCVPMMAHGETMGILHLNSTVPEQDRQKSADGILWFNTHKTRLAITVAESIALALSSLKLHETLRQQSIRDILTGLFNRRYMEESLTRELHLAEREKKPIGIVMFDIDNFKDFNDLYGHDGGDALLSGLGDFLVKNTRGGDIVCRYGGEEFVVEYPHTTLEDARLLAEKLRLGVKEMRINHLGKQLGKCTISLGVAAYPEHGLTSETILKSADTALYRAKNEGRDRVAVAAMLS